MEKILDKYVQKFNEFIGKTVLGNVIFQDKNNNNNVTNDILGTTTYSITFYAIIYIIFYNKLHKLCPLIINFKRYYCINNPCFNDIPKDKKLSKSIDDDIIELKNIALFDKKEKKELINALIDLFTIRHNPNPNPNYYQIYTRGVNNKISKKEKEFLNDFFNDIEKDLTLLAKENKNIVSEIIQAVKQDKLKSNLNLFAYLCLFLLSIGVFSDYLRIYPDEGGFYTLLRLVMTALSGVIIKLNWNKNNVWLPIFGFTALLFNPIIPVNLHRDTWSFIDFIAIITVLTYLKKNKNI